MSKLDELLRGVDVEFLPLGEIANFLNGKGHEKAISDDGKYIVVNSKFVSSEGKIIKYSDVQIVPLYIDDILIVMSDLPNGKALAKTFLVEDNNKYTLNQRIGRLSVKNKNALLPKYLNYILNRSSELLKFNNGVDQTNLKKNQILEVSIPIPCPDNPEKSLEIQQEIVRVLDELTTLTNQLTTELETERQNRKKQFEFFREQLFKEINLIKLGDNSVGEFIRGSGLQKKDFTESGVGCIHYGQLYTHYKTFAFETKTFVSEEFAEKARKASTGDLIIATTSENDDDVCKAVAWLGNEDIAVSSDACFYRHKFNPKYVAYYFQTEQFQKQKRKYITGTKVRRVNANDLAKILIPNPSLEEQERIVKLLDQLDATHTAIEEEITKEIKLRTQQYEYYREKLLSFPQN
ncbi:restriction endonuclease subunit S [Empedobacter stercoris]|uniref:restriction endonuclease subunit S n=1 Tax=Empedobacter stercoris TaxID=1628248 RepID=UPI0021AFF0BE|nr:restriction endonuclease subunit S [Empedobacter stercoris]UWX68063.1 restriction endonuclease subunit S [Empedobacter stercoris]